MSIIIQKCPIDLPLAILKPFSKPIKHIIVHCSATSPKQDIGVIDIDEMHRQRGFACIGYHYFIRRNGDIERGRPRNVMGAHVKNDNSNSLGVCMAGGIDTKGKSENNFTENQFYALKGLLSELAHIFPAVNIAGHRDFSPDLNKDGKITRNEWMKDCPCFDVKEFVKTNGIQ